MNNFINYDGVFVEFKHLDKGILDKCIQNGWYIGRDEKVVEQFIKPGDIVYDIGAYIGTHAIQYALLGGIVHAFEPSPNNFNRCKEHCKPFKQIRTYNVAFHEKEYSCETKFKDCNSSETTAHLADPVQKIKYVVLPDYVKKNDIPAPDFIKMDIEGMETIVLKTINDWFINIRPILLLECHVRSRNSGLPSYEDNPDWLYVDQGGFDFNLFHKYAYLVFEYNGKGLTQLDGDLNSKVKGGLLCVPVEKFIQNQNS